MDKNMEDEMETCVHLSIYIYIYVDVYRACNWRHSPNVCWFQFWTLLFCGAVTMFLRMGGVGHGSP